MSDFNVFLLRLVTALVLTAAPPFGPEPIAWAGALLLLAGLKARYVAGALGVAGVMALLAMPWSFDTQAVWLGFAGTAVFTLGLFAILMFGAGGISADEWLHAKKLRLAEADCRASPVKVMTWGHPLDIAVQDCMDATLRHRSRFLGWLESPSNPELRVR